MLELSDSQVAIHLCTFEGYFQKAKVNLRFPSLFFVEWKTINAKNAVVMVGRKKAVNSLIQLDQNLTFTTDMLFHRNQKRYLKKQSLIHLNLISNSRPDQVKLVGRVVIDLAQIANNHIYDTIQTCKLMYCSVDADISFRIKFARNIESNLQLNELDRSSFNDLYSFTSSAKNLIKNKLETKQSFNDKKSDDGLKKVKSKPNEKEEFMNRFAKSPPRNGRLDNILIKEQIEQVPDQKSLPHSLPLTEKKVSQPVIEQPKQTTPFFIEQNYTASSPNKQKIAENGDNLQGIIHKEKQILEKQINEHKNRIKKLETDIKQVMRLFQQSEEKSEINHSKLIQSEQIINQMKNNYQKQIKNIKQSFQRDTQLMKTGYQADLKILKGTIEQMRLRSQDQNNTTIIGDLNKIMKENEDMKAEIKAKDKFITQFNQIKSESQKFKQEKDSIVNEINKKEQQLLRLQHDNETLKSELASINNDYIQKMSDLNQTHSQQQSLNIEKISEFERIISQYKTSIDQYVNNIETSKQTIEVYKQKSLQFQASLVATKAQYAKLEQTSKKIASTGESSFQLQQLKVQNQNLKKQIEFIKKSIQQKQRAVISQTNDNQQLEEFKRQIQSYKLKIQQYETNLQITKEDCQLKVEQALKQLATIQEENAKLAHSSSQNLTSPVPILDEKAMKQYEQLKVQNQKIKEQVQNFKKGIALPLPETHQQLKRVKSEKDKLQSDLFILQEKSQLQVIELTQLKTENTAIRQKMDQLVQEHEQLKSSRNKEGSSISNERKKLDIQMQTEELNLIKEELWNQKQQKQLQKSAKMELQKKVQNLNIEIVRSKSQIQTKENLKQQLEFCKQTINFLQTEVQQLKGQLAQSTAPKTVDIGNGKTIEIPSLPQNQAGYTLYNQNQQMNRSIGGLENNPIRLEGQNSTIVVQVEKQSAEGANQNQNKQGNQVINLTVNLEEKSLQNSNNGSLIEDRYNYNFDQPLTHEQVNKISQSKFHEEDAMALRDENFKLREEIQQLKSQHTNKQNALNAKIEDSKIKIQQESALREETIRTIQKQKSDLKQEINALNDKVNQLTGQLIQNKQKNQEIPIQSTISINSHQQFIQKMQKCKQQIAELQTSLTNVRAKNEQLQTQLKSVDIQISVHDKDQALVKQFEYRIASLEDDIKIKDQLLAESEKYFIEIYNLRNQLVEVTNKYSGIQDQLTEKDNLITQLQDTKNQLTKDLQVLTQKIHNNNNNSNYSPQKKIAAKSQESITSPANASQTEVNDLRAEIETLRGELVYMNNKNSQLISNNQDTLNQKSETDRINEELKNKIGQLQLKNQSLPSPPIQTNDKYINLLQNHQTAVAKNAQLTTQLNKAQQINTSIQEQLKKVQVIIVENNEQLTKLTTLNQEIQQVQTKKNELAQLLTASQTKNSELSAQLLDLHQKIDQLSHQNQQNISNISKKRTNQFYSEQLNLEVHQVESNMNSGLPINYQQSTIPYIQNADKEETMKKQIISLKADLEKIKQDYAIELDLKLLAVSQLQNHQAKIFELQQQITSLKTQLDKVTTLPLQSFDTTPRNAYPYSAETLNSAKNAGQTSIITEQKVRAEAPTIDPQTVNFKKDGQTKIQTQANVSSQNEIDLIKKQYDILKEELESEAKLHFQLKQIHKICDKKYEILSIRYQNCFEQLKFLEDQNKNIDKQKKDLENQLNYFKDKNVGLEETLSIAEEEYNKLLAEKQALAQGKVAEPKQQNNKHQIVVQQTPIQNQAPAAVVIQSTIPEPTPEEKKIKDGNMKNAVAPDPEEARIWRQNQAKKAKQPELFLQFKQDSKKDVPAVAAQNIQVCNGLSQSQKNVYEQKLLILLKNEEQLKQKIAHLQENISNLDKTLQEQIQINQTNDKLSQKLQALSELENYAHQVQIQIEQLKFENEELKKLKIDYDILMGEKTDLMKVVQEHNLCVQERSEWQQKLDNIATSISQNEAKYVAQRQQILNKVATAEADKKHLQDEIVQLHEQQQLISKSQDIQQLKKRQQILQNDLQILRNQKLNQLEHRATLEEKINKLTDCQSTKEIELVEAITLKQQQIEQFKFINMQLKRQIEEVKTGHFQNSEQLSSLKKQSEQFRIKYQQALKTVETLKIKQSSTASSKEKQLNEQILSLQAQLQIVQEEKNHSTLQMTSELDRMQIELANKIQNISELEGNLAACEDQINSLKNSLQTKQQQMQVTVKGNQTAETQLNVLTQKYDTVNSRKNELQKESTTLKSKTKELQQKLKACNKASQAKDKSLQNTKSQMKKKEKEVSDLSLKLRQKQNQLIKYAKESESWKSQNDKNESKIKQLAIKQKMMKETMILIDTQSKKIVESLKSRYESEENYYRRYIQKERQCNRLSVAAAQVREEIANKERLLNYQQEQSNQLKSQLQMLKKGAGAQISPKIVTIEYEKYQKLMKSNDQLMGKNRQYLQMLSMKSSVSIENQQMKGDSKLLNAKINEVMSNYNQLKSEYDSRVADLSSKLQKYALEKQQDFEKTIAVTQELSKQKENKIEKQILAFDNALKQKQAQIQTLKLTIIELKEKYNNPMTEDVFVPKEEGSTISILNEQLLNMNRDLLQKDNQINRLQQQNQQLKKSSNLNKLEADILKDSGKADIKKSASVINGDFKKKQLDFLKKEEEYKIRISDLQNQLTSLNQPQILQVQNEAQSPKGVQLKDQSQVHPQHVTTNIQNMTAITQDLHGICGQIKQLCKNRKSFQQSDNLFQAFIRKYDTIEQQFTNLNNQTSCIQQKARFISKQLQKVKSFFIKSRARTYEQNNQLLSLLKPCQNAASELVNLSQTLSERDSQAFI